MEYLANLLLTLALTLQSTGPRVSRHFSSPGCEGCFLQQISIMQRFFREHDRVVITSQTIDEKSRLLSQRITALLPLSWPTFRNWCECADPQMVTGIGIEDPFSGEFLSYNAGQGTYNPMRARSLIVIYRDPVPRKPR